ncbi:MAG: nicotinic acid mononucleotide adenyltransferase [Nonlabens sp.]
MKSFVYIFLLAMVTTGFSQEIKPTVTLQNDGSILATFFHKNGKVAQQGSLVNDKRHGEWISYDENGIKTIQAEYTMDLKTGKWFFWKKDELIEVDYRNNQIASVNTWIDKDAIAGNRP